MNLTGAKTTPSFRLKLWYPSPRTGVCYEVLIRAEKRKQESLSAWLSLLYNKGKALIKTLLFGTSGNIDIPLEYYETAMRERFRIIWLLFQVKTATTFLLTSLSFLMFVRNLKNVNMKSVRCFSIKLLTQIIC